MDVEDIDNNRLREFSGNLAITEIDKKKKIERWKEICRLVNTTIPETLSENLSSYVRSSNRVYLSAEQDSHYRNYGRWYDNRPYYQSTPYETHGNLPWAGSYTRNCRAVNSIRPSADDNSDLYPIRRRWADMTSDDEN